MQTNVADAGGRLQRTVMMMEKVNIRLASCVTILNSFLVDRVGRDKLQAEGLRRTIPLARDPTARALSEGMIQLCRTDKLY